MRRAVVITALLSAAVAVACRPIAPMARIVGAQEVSDVASVGSTTAQPTFSLDWTRPMVPGRSVSTSSPVLVDDVAEPFVVAGDVGGNLRAFDLSDGTPVPGWSSTGTSFPIRAPLSSDGRSVFVPVGQDGKDRDPQYRRYEANGSLRWNSHPSTVLSGPGGFLLSGLSLADIGGTLRGFGGSSGHWVYGLDADAGTRDWRFRNADSTMATPAVVDLFGSGQPQVITSNDTSKEFPDDRHGGILRILTHDGRQICTATQLVDGDAYASSGYNNSSPAVAQVDAQPLIVFGSTGPSQSGVGGNQIVAYDDGCVLRWASAPLAAQARPSPTFADARGTGAPQVVAMVGIADGASTYPRVYVLDPRDGRVLDDTGTSLRPFGASLAYPPSTSIATADVDGDGAQDLFVPPRQGQFLVLDGPTLEVMATIPTNMAIQNTPIVTSEPGGGLRVTMAGYNGTGGQVSSYLVGGAAQLGANGWHRFGHDSRLSGVQGAITGPRKQMIEGQTLPAGGSLRSAAGGFTATMQPDGDFVLRDAAGARRWSSGTSAAGSVLVLGLDGELSVRSPGGPTHWRSGSLGTGTERLVLGSDGVLKVYSGKWATTRRLTTATPIWSSHGTVTATTDRIGRGQSLAAGQSLLSKDGSTRVVMQSDGNLVVYRHDALRWQSATRDTSGQARVSLGNDGNLVIYGANGRVLANYGLAGRGGVLLVARNDGHASVSNAAARSVWENGRVVK